MKILVTGGAGFIGSHLCEFLLNLGHEVICLDNFYTGQKSNIEPLLKNPRFRLVEHDVTEPYHVETDKIYNLASPASPIHYQRHPIKTITTCVLGAIHALELSKQCGNIPVLQASTSEVYGDPEIHPQPESYYGNVNPVGPRACYDEGKRAAETIFFDYFREAKIPIRVARIFNTYGPRMAKNDGRVISNFILQALRGEDITIFGDGSHTRSFCFVSDMIEGLYQLMENQNPGPVNVGNPKEFTMLELATLVLQLTKSKSQIRYSQPFPQDDPKQRRPDIALAKKLLQWEPKIELAQGLQETIAYFKKLLAS